MIFLAKFKDQDKTVQVAIEALSYTEAESKGVQIMKVVCMAHAELESITKTSFKEVLDNKIGNNENSVYFKGKIAYSSETGSGKLKTTKIQILVHATDAAQAYESLKDHADGFMDNARVFGFEETDILDYYDQEKISDISVKSFAELVAEHKIKFSFKVAQPEQDEEDETEEVGAEVFEKSDFF